MTNDKQCTYSIPLTLSMPHLYDLHCPSLAKNLLFVCRVGVRILVSFTSPFLMVKGELHERVLGEEQRGISYADTNGFELGMR